MNIRTSISAASLLLSKPQPPVRREDNRFLDEWHGGSTDDVGGPLEVWRQCRNRELLGLFAEVVQAQQRAHRMPAGQKQHRRVGAVEDLGLDAGVQMGQPFSGPDQPPQTSVHPARRGGRVIALGGPLPVHDRAVDPAVVAGVHGVTPEGIVVKRRQFVAHVQQRHAPEAQGDGV